MPQVRACAARKVRRRRSRGVLVFVYESVTAAGSQHRDGRQLRVWRLVEWCGWPLAERLVGSVLVVVSDAVDNEAFELSAVPDDGSVEELAAYRSDPAFGVGVSHRRADRTLEDLQALGAEDLVEGVDELAASVSDQGS